MKQRLCSVLQHSLKNSGWGEMESCMLLHSLNREQKRSSSHITLIMLGLTWACRMHNTYHCWSMLFYSNYVTVSGDFLTCNPATDIPSCTRLLAYLGHRSHDKSPWHVPLALSVQTWWNFTTLMKPGAACLIEYYFATTTNQTRNLFRASLTCAPYFRCHPFRFAMVRPLWFLDHENFVSAENPPLLRRSPATFCLLSFTDLCEAFGATHGGTGNLSQ